jgi:hypothetical protein
MADNRDELAKVDDVEIEPLSDQDLDTVAGGDSYTCTCSSCPTFTCPGEVTQPAFGTGTTIT